MGDEDNVIQILIMQYIDDVGDMRLNTNIATDQMTALAKAGESGREHFMPLGFQDFANKFPGPAAHSAAVHQ